MGIKRIDESFYGNTALDDDYREEDYGMYDSLDETDPTVHQMYEYASTSKIKFEEGNYFAILDYLLGEGIHDKESYLEKIWDINPTNKYTVNMHLGALSLYESDDLMVVKGLMKKSPDKFIAEMDSNLNLGTSMIVDINGTNVYFTLSDRGLNIINKYHESNGMKDWEW